MKACAPVFLLGAPRSGTTLLYKALSLHPRAAYISNWVHRFPALPQLAAFDRIARRLPEHRQRAWFPAGNAYAPGERRGRLSRAFPAPSEGEPVFTRAGVSTVAVTEPPAIGPEILRLREALATIARWNGGEHLLVKRIANNRRVPLLRAAFPEARFVELVRDGRAVALSLTEVDWWPHMRLWWLGQTPPEWVTSGGNELELGILHWAQETGTLAEHLAPVDPSLRLQVRYEDLVAEPGRRLREIAAFIGLPTQDEGWSSSLDRMSFPDQNERWRTKLDIADIAMLESAGEDALHRYGYGPIGGAPDSVHRS